MKFAYLYNTNYYNDKYGFKLTTGDVIRIGKVQFKIFTIHTYCNNNNKVISNSNITNCQSKYIVQINKPIGNINDKLLHTCRIWATAMLVQRHSTKDSRSVPQSPFLQCLLNKK